MQKGKRKMDFKKKIRLQNDGDYDFVEELMELAQSDKLFATTMEMSIHSLPYKDYTDENATKEILQLPRWRPKYADGESYEEKLARNFKVMIARYVKKANGIRSKKDFEGTQQELMSVREDPLHLIYSTLTEHGYHYYKDDFDKIPMKKFLKQVEENQGIDAMLDIKSEIKPFLDILPQINREKDKMKRQYIPLIEDALHEVLQTVDFSKTELEIIGYIAQGVRWKVNRSVTKLLDSKVHHINGERYFLTKEQIRKNGFKKTLPNTILQVDTSKLSSTQYVFFDMLCNRLQRELDAVNIKPFTFNEQGEPINFNKRYFADKMGMNESAFKKRLSRIQA